jgi:hypothetical protein
MGKRLFPGTEHSDGVPRCWISSAFPLIVGGFLRGFFGLDRAG